MLADRSIGFYECLDGFSNRVAEVDWKDVLDIIEDLSPADALFEDRDGTPFHGRVYRAAAGGVDLLVVSRIRERGWPEQYLGGRFSELQLPEGAALAESTHVAFFERNVAAVMRGPEGPFASRIEHYIMDKVDFGDEALLIKALIHPNVAERLADAEYLRRFTMKLPTSLADRLPSGAPLLRDVFRRASERYGNAEIELTIKIPTRGADQESRRLLAEVEAVIDAGALDVLEKANMDFVDRSSDHAAHLDFLNERVALTVEVELVGKTKTVRDASASPAIAQAYEALQGTINAIVPEVD